MHDGKRFGRSVQSRVGRRDGPHAHCRAKCVAVAREAAFHGNVATPLVQLGAVGQVYFGLPQQISHLDVRLQLSRDVLEHGLDAAALRHDAAPQPAST